MFLGKIDEILCIQAKAVARELKTIYTAPTEEDAQLALTKFNDIWGDKNILILLNLS